MMHPAGARMLPAAAVNFNPNPFYPPGGASLHECGESQDKAMLDSFQTAILLMEREPSPTVEGQPEKPCEYFLTFLVGRV